MHRRFARIGLVVVGAALLLAATAWLTDTYSPDRQLARWRSAEQEKARLASQEAEAKRCVAELVTRDPRADAEQDFARGDATPIGLSYWPHDPPEPVTRYIDACDDEYDGEYRKTGKWFGLTEDGFTHLGRPPSHHLCRREARDYAARYNRRMVELAPNAIRTFCLSQRLSEPVRQGAADIALFGDAARKSWTATGEIPESIDGKPYLTQTFGPFDTEWGAALVTYSRAPDSDCLRSNCKVNVGVAYLSVDGQKFELRKRWPILISAGGGKWRRGGVSYQTPEIRKTEYTSVSVSEATSRQDCRSMRETLIELRPAGPVNKGTAYTGAGQRKGGRNQASC